MYNLSLSVGYEPGIEPWTFEKIRKMQKQDPVVHKVLQWMKDGHKPPPPLIDMLTKFCGEKMNDWDKHLQYLMSAYRAVMNKNT